ncbi:MAG: nucleotidyl transferase AbiEii/AbiGii toxin family protein [Candidatus Omnitrophota bacterium]
MEIISPLQKEILRLFTDISDNQYFYLTGGTALSYFYLRHRRSDDLDFFTPTEELISPFSFRMEGTLKKKGILIKRQRGLHSFVELLAEQNNKKTIVHLACDCPCRLETINEFPEFPGLKVDSLMDIAANKLLALFGRAALRDFVDVYFLIKRKVITADDLIKKAKSKDAGLDLYWLGVAFERINTFDKSSTDMLLLTEPLDFKSLLDFYDDWRKEITQKLKE